MPADIDETPLKSEHPRSLARRLAQMKAEKARAILVENGEAAGWHTVVYGMLLALFSFPLRQALLHYAGSTQHSLLESATHGLPIRADDRAELRASCDAPIATLVRQAVPETPFTIA